MYCKKCGKEIDDNSNFCCYCGDETNLISQLKGKEVSKQKINSNSLDMDTKEPFQTNNKAKKSKNKRAIIIATLIIGLLSSIFLFYRNEKNKQIENWNSLIYLYINSVDINTNDIIGYENIFLETELYYINSNIKYTSNDIFLEVSKNSSVLSEIKEINSAIKSSLTMMSVLVEDGKIPNALYKTLYSKILEINKKYEKYYGLFNHGYGTREGEDSMKRTEDMIAILNEIRLELKGSFSVYLD